MLPVIDVDWTGVPQPSHTVDTVVAYPSVVEQTTSSISVPTHSEMPVDRQQVYASVLKSTNRIVRIQLELDKAQSDLDHWKTTQNSLQFAHISRTARTKLDSIRKSYDIQVSDKKKRLSRALSTLADLPELSRITPKVFNPHLDGQKIIAYTEELKDWIVDLRKHLLAITIPPETPQPPQLPVERRDSYEDGEIDSSLMSDRLDRGDRPLWTWNDLKSHVDQLECKIEQAVNQLEEAKIFHAFTTLSDITYETTAEQHQVMEVKISGRLDPDPIIELLGRANGLGDELGNQASLSSKLLLKVHTGEQTIKLLEDKKREHESMKTQVEAQFAQFERWRHDDSEQIRQISEQLQNLQARPRPLPPSMSAIDEILPFPQIHLKVRTALEQEVLPALEALLGESCSQIKQRKECTINDAFQKLRPALDMTEGICRRIELEMGSKKHSP